MRRLGHGRIINTSSIAGVIGLPFSGVYAASKHALEGASEALAHELQGTNMHVTTLVLDGVRTGIGARFQQPAIAHAQLGEPRRRLVRHLEQVTAEEGTGIDPVTVAHAVADAIESSTPPVRLVIGDRAERLIAARRSLDEAAFFRLVGSLDGDVQS